MTCKDKLKEIYPDYESVLDKLIEHVCPEEYAIAEDPDYCLGREDGCERCWNREIPEESEPVFEYRNPEVIGKVVDVKEENGGLTVTAEPIIKDSGDRTEFASGAVRDMREGKGRFDLVPIEVMARMYERHDGKCSVFDHILHFQQTNSTHHLIKALDRFALDAYGVTEKEAYATMFLEVAKHFEEGAKKYGEHNWQKGIPPHCYIDSAIRHYIKWLRGDMDEPHNRAFCWNLMCCIWEIDYHKEDNNA